MSLVTDRSTPRVESTLVLYYAYVEDRCTLRGYNWEDGSSWQSSRRVKIATTLSQEAAEPSLASREDRRSQYDYRYLDFS